MAVRSGYETVAMMVEKMAVVMEAVRVGMRVDPWVAHSAAMLAVRRAARRADC